MLRQGSSQLQKHQAARMFRRIGAVEQRRCSPVLAHTQGMGVGRIFSEIFPGEDQKWWNLFFPLKTKKTTFFLKISKSKGAGGIGAPCPLPTPVTQGCHIKKRNRMLVMHQKVPSSKLKWDSFEIWLRKSIRRPFIFQSCLVIFPWSHDLEKVTSLSVWLGVRRTPRA